MFRSYEEYVKKVDSYRTEQWSCCFTGKGGLTFVEAQEEEEKALKALAKVGGSPVLLMKETYGRDFKASCRVIMATMGCGSILTSHPPPLGAVPTALGRGGVPCSAPQHQACG